MYPYLGRIAQQHLAELRADAAHRRLVRAIRAEHKRAPHAGRRAWWALRRKAQTVTTREQVDAKPTSHALNA
jgi:hypothetical protein